MTSVAMTPCEAARKRSSPRPLASSSRRSAPADMAAPDPLAAAGLGDRLAQTLQVLGAPARLEARIGRLHLGLEGGAIGIVDDLGAACLRISSSMLASRPCCSS